MDTTVLLLGETGVGKEVFAKYLHKEGMRKDKPFIKINCGAIPPELMESEFFGYKKGAFTGADRSGKAGYFEVADGGTLFLDEIGELPLSMQVKLLRVLQEKEIMRVGSTLAVPVDVRIIAATNRELDKMVEKGTFREDLYYRLMVYPVRVPPLRERPDDIGSLAKHFVSELNRKYGDQKRFANLSLDLLIAYRWPGNIRELKNVVERAFIISNGEVIYPENLSIFGNRDSKLFEEREVGIQNLQDYLRKLEYEYIEAAYKKYGNVRDAAKSLGMSAPTFTRKKNRGRTRTV
jgi:transcriptional regulator with PAS, ATPase and Fis domain